MKWFIYVIKIYMHNLILWWRNHLIAIQHLLIIYASNHLTHQQHFRHQWVHSSIISYYHWLTYLSSIAAGFTVNLSAMPRDRSVFIPAAYPATRKSAYPLLNWSIYLHTSCRLHDQSICHATRSINLHTSCISRDQEICLSATQLISLHTSCVLHDERTCLPAIQLINLHTSCMLHDGGTCISTGHAIDPSTYQLHTPRPGNLPISHVIGQSMS